jgi:methyltransferase (TIGR00027 family)
MSKVTASDKTATTKAMEQLFDEKIRLFHDPHSVKFISAGKRFFINMMKVNVILKMMLNWMENLSPGVYGLLACRMRYMDDVAKKCIAEGYKTIVNLGAGFDTRALRIGEFKDINYYQMDLPEVIAHYKKTVKKKSLDLPSGVHLVPIDFNHQSIENALQSAGYDKRQKTLFIWEGVTQYISVDALKATLSFVASTARGSHIAFSYVLRDAIENPSHYPALEKVIGRIQKMSTPWVSGLDEESLGEYLDGFGLKLVSDVGGDYYQKNYLEPMGRKLNIAKVERIALAKVK